MSFYFGRSLNLSVCWYTPGLTTSEYGTQKEPLILPDLRIAISVADVEKSLRPSNNTPSRTLVDPHVLEHTPCDS